MSLFSYLAAAATGALISSCFLRFWLFPLAWIAFVPLLWALARAGSRRQAMALGYVAGLVTNLPAFYWLVYTIHVFGGFPVALALLVYLLLTALTALQFVLFAVAWRRCGWGPLGLGPPLLWVSLEFLYPNLFPWRMAHCQMEVPVLLQIGDLTGPYGLSFAIVWVSSGAALLLERPRRWTPLAAAATMTLAIIAYGMIRLPQIERAMAAAPTVRVALVQGNIGIKEKGNLSFFEVNLEKYRQLSQAVQDDVDLIVWPETVNQHWIPAEAGVLDPSENPFVDLRTHLIFGGLAYRRTGPRTADEFNSAFLMSAGGRIEARYDKRILMPFGEYIPGGSYFPAVYALSPETGHFTPGPDVQVFDIGGKAKVGQLICFEDIVAGMPRATTGAGAEVLVTILNDAWYGNTAAPYQHQALALWRTVENRRYLLRGSNTGVTSIIDAAGRVVAEGGLFTAEVVRGDVHRLQLDSLYTRIGDAFAWSIVITAALLLWRRGRAAGAGDTGA